MGLGRGTAHELLVGSVNVDDGVASEQVAHGLRGRRSPTQRHDCVARERASDRVGFHDTEGGLAIDGENVGDRSPLAFLDEIVGVHVVHAEAGGQQATDLRLTGAG